MKEAFLVVLGIGVGYWFRGRSIERARLKEENALLMAKLKEKEANKGGEN